MSPIYTSVLLALGLGFFGWTMFHRMRLLVALKRENRFDRPLERLKALVVFGLGQKRLVDPEELMAGILHVIIFVAFGVVSLRTITMFGIGYSENFQLPLLGETEPVGRAYLFAKDVVVLLALVAAAGFMFIRLFIKPDRLTLHWEGLLILGFIMGLMATDMMFDGARFARAQAPASWMTPAGSIASAVYHALGVVDPALRACEAAGLFVHTTIILLFLNVLPYGKHFHVITALPNVYFKRIGPPGALSKPDLKKEEFGVKTAADLSWKHLFDVYSCTECGRCETHCPTYVTGKPLTHKQVNVDLKRHLLAMEERLVSGKKDELPPLVPEVLSPETVWACTTCGWCETACPVLIENVPRLIDMRRYQVQVEGKFPQEARRAFKGMETQSNPWSMDANTRTDWCKDLDIPRANGAGDFDYLFFVGCAGSFDDRQKKVSRAIVKILRLAKVKFAILENEGCTGDPARRLGNEYLFQTLAQANVEALNPHKDKTVVTQCPHCFNTIKNEYPQFGGDYKVIHHSELIAELFAKERLTARETTEAEVTYHDACYLGRINEVYEPPRQALRALPGLTLIEMPRCKRESFCCGAGGGRMWLEERIGTRINQNRVEEVAKTGAKCVATACPFCLTMLKDGVSETGREDQIRVKDIAEIVVASLSD